MTAPKYVRPAPAGGPPLNETTARLRSRLDEQLAPAIRQRNDAKAQRDDARELQEAAARELLIACDFIAEACDAGDFNPDGIKTFAQAVAEMCRMLIEPARAGSPRSDDRRVAMRAAVDALMAKIRPDGAP